MDIKRALTVVSLVIGATTVVYLVSERLLVSPDPPPPTQGSPVPSPSASSLRGRDIGLDHRVCRVSQADGLDLGRGGQTSTAWTAAKVGPNGRCDRSLEDSHVVAVDVDGDGLADASSKPLRYCVFCRPLAATDVDGDGDRELLVLEQGGSTSSYSFYEITGKGDRLVIFAIPVAKPGHPEAGHVSGRPLRFWVGGDEGFAGAATCTGYPADPLLVVEWTDHPVDGPGSETTEIHLTTFRLRGGAFHVLEAADMEEPTDPRRPSGFERSRDVCGVNLSRPG